ncbi:hypothetical protein [Ligilactobacillus agilis]|uniref:hypothetical protein n=1 Tax=Ligilactobacillus agilis TaxID=1601 RepID=UPI001959D757|nr:hypothetical protein [Ligilactobacillus agilis]MBM6762209.1 hypothetical protein [Ligilactobacillus agilis]
MKFGNVYVNQADISFASKVDVNVTFRGPALPSIEQNPMGKFGDILGSVVSIMYKISVPEQNNPFKILGDDMTDETDDSQVVTLSVSALRINFKNGKTKTIVPFPVKYNNGYEHIFDTTNDKPIEEYAQSYIKKYRNQVNSWLSQLK